MTPIWSGSMSGGPWRDKALTIQLDKKTKDKGRKNHLLLFTFRLITNLNDANQDYLYHPSNSHRYGYPMMKKIFFILLTLLTSSSHADEVFKCQLKSGKTVYQSLPCGSAVKQQTIEIQKPDPRKVAEEEAKLKAWEEDFAKREAERIKAEKEQQAELGRKASIEALKKSAEYQQRQAYEAKRQADALERQNMQPLYPQYPFYPSPIYPAIRPYPFHLPHQHDIKEKTVPDNQQSDQTGLKSRKDTDGGSGDGSRLFLKWK